MHGTLRVRNGNRLQSFRRKYFENAFCSLVETEDVSQTFFCKTAESCETLKMSLPTGMQYHRQCRG